MGTAVGTSVGEAEGLGDGGLVVGNSVGVGVGEAVGLSVGVDVVGALVFLVPCTFLTGGSNPLGGGILSVSHGQFLVGSCWMSLGASPQLPCSETRNKF